MTKQKESGISWTEETWNPVRGCSRISKGCMNCYAEGVANRFKGPGMPYEGLIAKTGQWNGEVRLIEDKLLDPIRWKRPRLIFVNSMSDLFHESLTDEQIDKVFAVMAVAHHHTFQVLTKRADRMAEYLSKDRREAWARASMHLGYLWNDPDPIYDSIAYATEQFLPSVWLGVSVEDQATANERIPYLLETPAAVRWISAEPLLGRIKLNEVVYTSPESDWVFAWDALRGSRGHRHGATSGHRKLDWVVVGGESGSGARPMHPDWARSLRDQCKLAGVPFHFKQWGSWEVSSTANGHHDCNMETNGAMWVDLDGSVGDAESGKDFSQACYAMVKVGKKKAGRLLDGREWDEYPAAGQMAEVNP